MPLEMEFLSTNSWSQTLRYGCHGRKPRRSPPPPIQYTYPFSCYISLSSLLCIFVDVSKLLQFVDDLDVMVFFAKHYEKIIFVTSFDLGTILLAEGMM